MTMFYQPPIIVVDGKEYQIRRLNIKDIFTIAEIISKASKSSNDDEFLHGKVNAENTINFLVSSIIHCQDDIIKFFASLINVKPEEFAEMPMDTIVEIADKLREHEDLKSFFEKVRKILPRNLLIMNQKQSNK